MTRTVINFNDAEERCTQRFTADNALGTAVFVDNNKHWLPSVPGIDFQLLVITYKASLNAAPGQCICLNPLSVSSYASNALCEQYEVRTVPYAVTRTVINLSEADERCTQSLTADNTQTFSCQTLFARLIIMHF